MTGELIGQQIEHYRIEEILGKGGMGTVYRAEDINLARLVAVKVMHASFAEQPEFQQRFKQEAQASARLEHPSIVRVYHFGREQGLVYMVMELIPGLSLGSYLKQLAARKQVIRLDETLLLMAQVADALGYAHRKGVIHRDIKPDNIIVRQIDQTELPNEPPLRAVVTDFGLAKLMEGGIETKTGEFMGTLAYVSPEVVMDQPLDGRSDIYSLGIVLFELTTGQLPFHMRTPSDAIRKHLHQQPPVLQEIQPGIPIHLSQIIWKALAKSPADRYQTGEELAADLRQVAATLPPDQPDFIPPIEQSSVVSMVIALDSDPNLADTSRWFGDKKVEPPGYDRLLIHRKGEEPEIYSLYKRSFTLGRSQDNDIILVGNNVSRRHARLEYVAGAWQISDAGSTNGTLLDGQKLLPGKAQIWLGGKEVSIGPFFLNIDSGGSSSGPEVQAANNAPVQAAAIAVGQKPSPQQSKENIVADLRPKLLKKSGICRVLLLNKGSTRAFITLSAGAPNGQIRFDEAAKQLPLSPGQKGIVDFYLEADKRPLIGRRRTIPFRLRVSSQEQDWGALQGELQVRPQISIWLLLVLLGFLLIFILALAAFFAGLLPWAPADMFPFLATISRSTISGEISRLAADGLSASYPA